MSEIGQDKFRIELIEEYPCSSKQDLRTKEAEWILKEGTLNRAIPGRTQKQRYEDNKDKLCEKQRMRSKLKKEEISEKKKEYYNNKKEDILLKRAEYREKNREQIRERDRIRHQMKKHIIDI